MWALQKQLNWLRWYLLLPHCDFRTVCQHMPVSLIWHQTVSVVCLFKAPAPSNCCCVLILLPSCLHTCTRDLHWDGDDGNPSCHWTMSWTSSTYWVNTCGPGTDLYRTPSCRAMSADSVSPVCTTCLLFLRNSATQPGALPSTLNRHLRTSMRMEWSAVSKAADR